MLFACSIENTQISFGVFQDDDLLDYGSIAADRSKSADEYALLFASLLTMHQIDPRRISGAIVASVVRPLNKTVSQAVEKLCGIRPIMVGPGIKTGLNIKTDIPSQVGADIVANAVAATVHAGRPLVVIDLGTATTLTGINEAGELCGVLICPGVRSSLDALSARAAELPAIDLEQPRQLLGKNTIDAMVSGVMNGHAAMIDGLLDRIGEAWNNHDMAVMATGDLAEIILASCTGKRQVTIEPHLTLIGLKLIHRLNMRAKP